MLGKSKIIAFVPTRNPKGAKNFYEGILGLQFLEDNPFALVLDANGIMFRIAKTENFTPSSSTILGWQVSNIELVVKQLKEKNIDCVQYDFIEQDTDGIWNAPGGNKVAWFKDPDGNLLSITQF